jgi:hypothetical protein
MPDADWLHGDLATDEEFRNRWAAYLQVRLAVGMEISDAEYVSRRLDAIAVEKTASMAASFNAGADLMMFARTLASAVRRGHAVDSEGLQLHVQPGTDLVRLTAVLFRAAHAGDDSSAALVAEHWSVRQEAEQTVARCRDDDVQSWSQLIPRWIEAMLRERLVYRWYPASKRNGSGPTSQVQRLFGDADQLRLEKQDAELEENFADMFTALLLHATDEGQTAAHEAVMTCLDESGRLAARALLREMRRDFRIAPWNFATWDDELRTATD